MENSIIINIRLVALSKGYICQFSLDLTLYENMVLFMGLFNKYYSDLYRFTDQTMIIESESGSILNQTIILKEINLNIGDTLLVY